jgi:hypothetical protein
MGTRLGCGTTIPNHLTNQTQPQTWLEILKISCIFFYAQLSVKRRNLSEFTVANSCGVVSFSIDPAPTRKSYATTAPAPILWDMNWNNQKMMRLLATPAPQH